LVEVLVPVVEAELALLQVQFKGVAGHSFELGEPCAKKKGRRLPCAGGGRRCLHPFTVRLAVGRSARRTSRTV